MIKKVLFIFLLFFISVFIIFGQGENLTLKIAVIGPGDELYLWWGHIALIIEDSFTGRKALYDYGQFSFDQENFFYNFAFGRLYYNCGVSNTDYFLLLNSKDNRDIVIYTLDIPAQKRMEIKEFAETNVLPENKYYEYHHFKDNCSTRIRDIIDLALDGQFYKQYGQEPGRYTLRQHVRRHTWFSSPADWLLNFLMGQRIDTPITIWEEMFLPSEVGKRIEDFYYTDSNGVNTKLVKSVETFNRAKNRPEVLEVPRKQWPRELVFSIALSAIFSFFFFLTAKNKRIGRILAGISMGFCAFVFGVAGVLLYFMGLFTNHDYTFNNMNMIFSSPVLLLAVPFGICYAFTRNQDKQRKYDFYLRLIWFLTVLGIVISMFLKILPYFYQQNLTDQMLMLPIALVFTFQPVGLRDAWHKLKEWKLFRR